MLPAHATFLEPPPIPQGMVAVLSDDGQAWELVPKLDAPSEDGGPAPTLEDHRAAFARWVDEGVDKVYADVIGNRAQEYVVAEEEARDYLAAVADRDADPDDDTELFVPDSVQADVDATGRTPEAAATLIVNMADAWHAARVALRRHRLAFKSRGLQAGTSQDLAGIAEEWSVVLASIRSSLGV